MEALVIFASFFVAQIAQRIIVPILVRMMGERRFASPSAFDGCTLGIAGVMVAGFGIFIWDTTAKTAAKYHKPFHFSPLWILLVVAVGITLYGLIYLWVLGMGAKKREWGIVDGQILNTRGQQLQPTFVRERSDYNQTDAYNGYSQFFLELHNDSELLATNAYNSKEEFKSDVERVGELTNARRLDLVWSWRVEERKWMVAYFTEEWALVLGGPLDRLTADDREWWHGWVYPNFAVRIGTEVNSADALERLERLKAAYAEEIKSRNTNSKLDEELGRLLRSEGPVIALDRAQFDKQVEEVRGNATMMTRRGDFIELEP